MRSKGSERKERGFRSVREAVVTSATYEHIFDSIEIISDKQKDVNRNQLQWMAVKWLYDEMMTSVMPTMARMPIEVQKWSESDANSDRPYNCVLK